MKVGQFLSPAWRVFRLRTEQTWTLVANTRLYPKVSGLSR